MDSNLFTSLGGGFRTQFAKQAEACFTYTTHMPSYGAHLGDHAGFLAEFMWRRANTDNDRFMKLIADINMTFKDKYLCKVPIISS